MKKISMLMFILVSAFFLLSFSIQGVFAESAELSGLIHHKNVGPSSCSILSYESYNNVHEKIIGDLKAGKLLNDVLARYQGILRNGQYRLSSAVFIDPRGYILSNDHCVGDQPDTHVLILWSAVYKGKMEIMEAQVVARDKEKDITLLRVKPSWQTELVFPTVKFARNNPGPLEEGISIGAPLGLLFSVATFEVNGIRSSEEVNALMSVDSEKFESGMTFLQISGKIIKSGSSGSPLFNKRGEFVGMVSRNVNEYNKNLEGITFAISVEDIRKWLGKEASFIVLD